MEDLDVLARFEDTNPAHRHWVMATFYFTHEDENWMGPKWRPFLAACPFYPGMETKKFDFRHLFTLLRYRCLHAMAKESPTYRVLVES